MSGESQEVQMARIDERMKYIVQQLERAEAGRKQQYEVNESIQSSMSKIYNRLEGVEKSLAVQAPTIQEFITVKQKVVGAGLLGRWLWVAVGGLLTFVYSSRETIIGWLTK